MKVKGEATRPPLFFVKKDYWTTEFIDNGIFQQGDY